MKPGKLARASLLGSRERRSSMDMGTNPKIHVAVANYIKSHFFRPMSLYLPGRSSTKPPRRPPSESSDYVMAPGDIIDFDFGGDTLDQTVRPTTDQRSTPGVYEYDVQYPPDANLDGIEIAYDYGAFPPLPQSSAVILDLSQPSSVPPPAPAPAPYDETPSSSQSEIARGKQPLRDPSPPRFDGLQLLSEGTPIPFPTPRSPGTAQTAVRSNSNDEFQPALDTSPAAISPDPGSSSGPSSRVGGRLAELKRYNRLVLANIRLLEKQIDLLDGGAQLLASVEPGPPPAEAPLIDSSIPTYPDESPSDSPPAYFPDHPTPVVNDPTPSNKSDDALTVTGPAASQDSPESPPPDAAQEEANGIVVNDANPIPVPSVEQRVNSFLEAARLLKLALDGEAEWLADVLDLQDSQGIAQYTSSEFPDEKEKENAQYTFNEFPREKEKEKTPIMIDEKPPIPIDVFLCGVCLEERPTFDVTRINSCEHSFCRDCLRSYLTSKIKEHRYPVHCPTCVAERGEDEPQAIGQDVLQQVGVGEKDFAIFEQLQMSAHSVLWHCRSCGESVFVDKQEFLTFEVILCPVPGCGSLWCQPCGQEIQFDVQHTCDGSNELEMLTRDEGWKHCPGCSSLIQKDPDGCNHLICVSPGCNTHFCYLCGTKIVRSSLPREIEQAVQAHYSRCTLFEVPPGTL